MGIEELKEKLNHQKGHICSTAYLYVTESQSCF